MNLLLDTVSRRQGEQPSSDERARINSEAQRLYASKILIVDDEPINVKVVRKQLQGAGYSNFLTTTDPTQAMAIVHSEQPDVVLLDVMMPEVNGLQILDWIRQDERFQHTPVLILTASSDTATKLKALELGATDFLAKPVDPNELLPRLRNVLIVKAHQDHLAGYSVKLEQEVRKRTAELEMSRLRVIQCLARAGEYRDDTTGRHVIRVGRCAAIVAGEMKLGVKTAAMIEVAAQLHDIGKIGIPDAILLKPGKLTIEEFAIMRKHCEFGKAIIDPTSDSELEVARKYAPLGYQRSEDSESPLLAMAAAIALSHHERFSGQGYPAGLSGDAIPLEGRITAIVDAFDALHTIRPYKPALPLQQCIDTIRQGRGTEFDPIVLDALLARVDEITQVYQQYADETEINLAA